MKVGLLRIVRAPRRWWRQAQSDHDEYADNFIGLMTNYAWYIGCLLGTLWLTVEVWRFDFLSFVLSLFTEENREGVGILFFPSILVMFFLVVAYADLLRSMFSASKRHTGREVFLNFLLIAFLVAVFGKIYTYSGLHLASDPEAALTEIDYIYFSVVTWTTLGFGDILPTEVSKVLVIAQVMIGFLMNSIFVAAVITLFTKRPIPTQMPEAPYAHTNPPQ